MGTLSTPGVILGDISNHIDGLYYPHTAIWLSLLDLHSLVQHTKCMTSALGRFSEVVIKRYDRSMRSAAVQLRGLLSDHSFTVETSQVCC
jgi:hypothetical protein